MVSEMCVREMQLEVPEHHVPETSELCSHHLRHWCTLCSAWKGLGSEEMVLPTKHFSGC